MDKPEFFCLEDDFQIFSYSTVKLLMQYFDYILDHVKTPICCPHPGCFQLVAAFIPCSRYFPSQNQFLTRVSHPILVCTISSFFSSPSFPVHRFPGALPFALLLKNCSSSPLPSLFLLLLVLVHSTTLLDPTTSLISSPQRVLYFTTEWLLTK